MGGLVWECDPAGKRRALSRPAMGVFKHEAAAVDPEGRRIYLTEDLMDGGVYRFTPARWHDLSEGLLEIATVGRDGRVSWSEVPDPGARRTPTRQQPRGQHHHLSRGRLHPEPRLGPAASRRDQAPDPQADHDHHQHPHAR